MNTCVCRQRSKRHHILVHFNEPTQPNEPKQRALTENRKCEHCCITYIIKNRRTKYQSFARDYARANLFAL